MVLDFAYGVGVALGERTIDHRTNTCTPMFPAKYKVSPNDMDALRTYAQMALRRD